MKTWRTVMTARKAGSRRTSLVAVVVSEMMVHTIYADWLVISVGVDSCSSKQKMVTLFEHALLIDMLNSSKINAISSTF